MAREFWEMFLPENIIVLGARWEGKSGTAEIKFRYPESNQVFCAKFLKANGAPHNEWHLEEIT